MHREERKYGRRLKHSDSESSNSFKKGSSPYEQGNQVLKGETSIADALMTLTTSLSIYDKDEKDKGKEQELKDGAAYFGLANSFIAEAIEKGLKEGSSSKDILEQQQMWTKGFLDPNNDGEFNELDIDLVSKFDGQKGSISLLDIAPNSLNVVANKTIMPTFCNS